MHACGRPCREVSRLCCVWCRRLGGCSTEQPARDASSQLARGRRGHRRAAAVSASPPGASASERPRRVVARTSRRPARSGPAPEITAGTPCEPAAPRPARATPGIAGLALPLVQEVLGRPQQQLGSAAQRRDEQRGPTGVRGRVGVRDVLGQQPAGRLGEHAVGGTNTTAPRPTGRRGTCSAHTVVAGLAADHEPAEQRRADVVGMTLDPVGQGQRRGVVEPLGPAGDQGAGQDDAAHDRGRRGAHAAAVRDPVGAP